MHFYILTLYPFILLNKVLIVLFCKFLGWSTCIIMPSAKKYNLTSSFPHFLSSLVVLARTFSPMLHRSSESRYSCLVPNLRGENV